MTKQTKQVELAENISDQFSFKISPTMSAILEEQGEAEFEMGGKIYKLLSEEKYAQTQQEAYVAGRDHRKMWGKLPQKEQE